MCLKHLAETMQQCFPKDSILGRYGGDEFVVYLKNMTAETVKRYIEEFQKKSANLTLSTGEKVQLTTSYRAVQKEWQGGFQDERRIKYQKEPPVTGRLKENSHRSCRFLGFLYHLVYEEYLHEQSTK